MTLRKHPPQSSLNNNERHKGSNLIPEMRVLAEHILHYQSVKEGIKPMIDIVGNPINIEEVENKLVEYREKIKNITV